MTRTAAVRRDVLLAFEYAYLRDDWVFPLSELLVDVTSLTAMLDCGNAGYSHFDDLLCCFIHNFYRIGQITKLREWYATSIVAQRAGRAL